MNHDASTSPGKPLEEFWLFDKALGYADKRTMPATALILKGYRLDLGTRQLFRGATEVRLSPKAFDLLQTLVENRTRALSKAELHDRLWPGTFVTEANLASLVAELRRALEDPPRDSKFVRTVHRFGYAFCGEVEGDSATVVDAPSPSRAPAGLACWIVWRGREIPLTEGENIIGRDADVAVHVDAPSVSRRHARITVSPDGATIDDLGSKNGTLVGKERITAAARLDDLEEVQVGSVRMTFRIMRGGETTLTRDL